jgi:hypothetical protein
MITKQTYENGERPQNGTNTIRKVWCIPRVWKEKSEGLHKRGMVPKDGGIPPSILLLND